MQKAGLRRGGVGMEMCEHRVGSGLRRALSCAIGSHRLHQAADSPAIILDASTTAPRGATLNQRRIDPRRRRSRPCFEAIANALRVEAALTAFADVHGKARDWPSVLVFMRVHRTVITETAHELIIGRCYRGKAAVLLIGDRGSEDFEVVRALHELLHASRTHRGPRRDGVGEEAGASKRQRRRGRERARVNGSKVVIAKRPTGDK